MATWSQSVKKARTALLKTFEGRMAVAAASFEQIPPNGKGATRTLADFAEDVGIEYQTLANYRAVYFWLNDLTQVGKISSWSLAAEAMASKRWRDGATFASFLAETTPPVFHKPGYEPHAFTSWTVDALRVYLGREPKGTTLAALKAAEIGKEPAVDDLHAAAASDAMESVKDEVEAIDDPTVRREASRAVLHESLGMLSDGLEPEGRMVHLDSDLYHLPTDIREAKDKLVQLLERVPDFVKVLGRQSSGDGDSGVDLVFDVVHQVRGEVDHACDAITGDFETELLALGKEG